jgi:hypothetical protein
MTRGSAAPAGPRPEKASCCAPGVNLAGIAGRGRCYPARGMKIGEWDTLGRARELLQRQMGDLGATEYATHVTLNPDTGRLRIYVATDLGLLEYSYAPAGTDAEAAWLLRGQLYRWPQVRALRLQTDAQLDEETGEVRAIWRLVAEDPKLELAADSSGVGDHSVAALLPFARACIQHAG